MYDYCFYSNGKILLTGEYILLKGALGLALPTKKGQFLLIKKLNHNKYFYWVSINEKKEIFFKAYFNFFSLNILYCSNIKIALYIQNILKIIKKIKPFIFNIGLKIKTILEFPLNWGLGSSSTLICNISKWTKINLYYLFKKISNGSGYDVYCSLYGSSLLYNLKNNKPNINFIYFNPPFKKKLYFIYLNKKKNTEEEIIFFLKKKNNIIPIDLFNNFTKEILKTKKLNIFENVLFLYEKEISKILNIKCIKEKYFKNYQGIVKSLGAWGGDFALVSKRKGMKNYFYKKGYNIIIPFEKMIL
ncbi:GYDIA family GHMP kinase [Candidatus Shikimatogenerans silvanidophilus]|uniref:GYDIA family GHMP kinase n=1 Tax=Candidatus Shikimatogenerans silvanidophilus TaxID=2782547 RepID=UPI001BA76E99|nr:GYDIA family GHMP kinase [Candidatus Shikimatogenerans silvanidophilus]